MLIRALPIRSHRDQWLKHVDGPEYSYACLPKTRELFAVMVMRQKVRTPRVQDREKSNLGAESPWVGGHLEQRLGTGFKQQVEEISGSSESQRVQLVGNGEHDMEVVDVEQVALLRLDPALSSLCLTLWART
jgi:hypothetical protein